MSLQGNKDAIRNFWNEVFNNKKLEIIDGLFNEDYVYHGAAGQDIHGREGLKQFLTMYFNAFPDIHAEIEDIFGEDDKVASRVMCRGTHQGVLMGMPATGKQVAIRVICTNLFSGQQIVEDWELPDIFSMMQQLGAISK